MFCSLICLEFLFCLATHHPDLWFPSVYEGGQKISLEKQFADSLPIAQDRFTQLLPTADLDSIAAVMQPDADTNALCRQIKVAVDMRSLGGPVAMNAIADVHPPFDFLNPFGTM